MTSQHPEGQYAEGAKTESDAPHGFFLFLHVSWLLGNYGVTA
jgi:hypothetical protein